MQDMGNGLPGISLLAQVVLCFLTNTPTQVRFHKVRQFWGVLLS
jgi:hypothetical protein